MKRYIYFFFVLLAFYGFTACTNLPENVTTVNRLPVIFPDYTDVTIPVDIAPLNFNIVGRTDAVDVVLKGEKGEAYNVADAQSCITIRSLAEKIAALADRQVIIDIPQDATQGNTTPISCATFATKKIEALGWKPRYTIDEGLRQTLQRLQNQG